MRHFLVHQLGLMPYERAHTLQRQLVELRTECEIGDQLLMVQHPPVLTLGRGTRPGHIRWSEAELGAKGFSVHEVGRGGDVTYHGPGQLVCYPILSLGPDRCDVRRYVADLEETMIRVCADWGVDAGRIAGLNGTWVGDRKIGAVGVRISRWVTMHGFAFNVATDLDHFDAIVPCGIEDKGVTSLTRELGRDVDLAEVTTQAATHLAQIFCATVEWAAPARTRELQGQATAATSAVDEIT